MSYQKLTPMFESMIKPRSTSHLKAELGKTIAKNMEQKMEVGMMPMEMQAMYSPKLNAVDFIATDELLWNKTGRKAVFVESQDLIDAILNSKFDATSIENIPPIHECFQLILPKGAVTPNGAPLYNSLICWNKTVAERTGRIEDVKCGAVGVDPSHIRQMKELIASGEIEGVEGFDGLDMGSFETPPNLEGTEEEVSVQQVVNICLSHPEQGGLTKAIYEEEFPAALQGNGASETGEDCIESILKLTLGLAIYLNAGGELKAGIPQKASKMQLRKLKPMSGGFISLPTPHQSFTGGFVRGFHFRNLKHSKYYQGEYADAPSGSRWIFVSPYWVGNKVSAETAQM